MRAISTRRDFIDVRDAVAAFDALLQVGEPGQAYNVATGCDITIESILRQLLAIAHLDAEIEARPERRRDTDVPVVRADVSKLRTLTRDLALPPAISLEQSLQDQWNSHAPNTPSS